MALKFRAPTARSIRVRALAGCAVLALSAATAMAQQSAAVDLDIGAQPLSEALIELGRQAGVEVVFAPGAVANRQAAPVRGQLTPEQALQQLLADTGMDARRTPEGAFVVEPAPVQQQGSAPPETPPVATIPSPPPPPPPVTSDDRVVVTGSRIQRQDFTANSPIVTIDQSTFENTSTIGIETVLNQLPQFIPSATTEIGSQFSTGALEGTSFQTPGASTVNLRGLGANRNLVLVDGRRAMATNASMAVDVNSIPSSAIERVEIISGGASAVYGADAVGGVVNFILRNNFEGMTFDTQYGISELGDNTEFRISGLYGSNLANGRGNVMFGAEHASRGPADAYARDWRMEELRHPNVSGTEFWYSDTYYDGSGAYFDYFSEFLGFIGDPVNNPFPTAAGAPDQAAVDFLFDQAASCAAFPGDLFAPLDCPEGAVSVTNNFFINRSPTGAGRVYTGGRNFGAGQPAGAYRYDGVTDVHGFPYRVIQADGSIGENQAQSLISLPMERYSFFGRGRFDLTDDIALVTQGTFARTRTSTVSQYSPAVGLWAVTVPHGSGIYGDSVIDTPTNPAILGYDPFTGDPIYNPAAQTNPAYLPGGGFGLAGCVNPDGSPRLTGGCTNSEVFPLPPELEFLLSTRPDPNGDVQLNRNLDFLPPRQTRNVTTNFQLVLGLEGTLNSGFARDWVWDVSLSHGQAEAYTEFSGFASLQRYRAVAGSPNFGRSFFQVGNEGQGGGGTGSCTSGLPLIEEFAVSDDCVRALEANMQQKGQMQQNVLEANIAGDLFDLPAGPLQFALGSTYRENQYRFRTDIQQSVGSFSDQVIGLFPLGDTDARVNVAEIYGELLVPIVRDLPGVQALNLELGGRYSQYDPTGGVETFKALIDWTVVDWARFRGGYNQATRAPNIGELYLGRTQLAFGSSGVSGDVCSTNNYTSSLAATTESRPAPDGGVEDPLSTPQQAAHTRAICEGLMGSSAGAFYNLPRDQQPDPGGMGSVFYTGNPDVDPETARTWTAGVVLRSPFEHQLLSGLQLTVDYFQIRLSDIIATEAGDTVTAGCFSLEQNPNGDLDNPFCERIERNPQTGASSFIETTYTNDGRANFSGVDVQLNWMAQLADLGLGALPGGIGINVLATIPVKQETQLTPDAAPIDWVGTQGCAFELGLSCSGYRYTAFTTFNYFAGPFNASLRWQHYPSIRSFAYATNPDTTSVGVPKSYNLFALSAGYRINDMVTLRGGIENLFNTKPPLQGGNPAATPFATLPTRAGGGLYDPLGRRFFAGLTATF